MADEPTRIVVVGSTNIDLTFRVPHLPRPGETLAGSSFRLGFGGKGANQAVMAARLGAVVTMVSRVGRDVFGDQALANYRAHGVNVTHVRVDDEQPTGMAAIAVDDAARNSIVVVPGANGCLTPQDVREAAESIREADIVLCQLEVPTETVDEALRLARDAEVRTILNPAPAALLPDELLQRVDLCVPNETEIELLTGQAATSLEEAAAAAWKLVERGPNRVVVTLGERGVLFADAQSSHHVAAVSMEAVDPTGAGDAFIGSLAVYWAGGLGLYGAVRQANVVAALSVTRPGTQTAFPSRDEVETFLRWVGI